ncbi:MAG: FAD-binding domain-containing protein [Ilumatobacter sp.]|uniref:FAD-binding domain-containing protein n=1 Tax=Ilumatobacter sp. TaxID=1967498 RepID=UPI002622CF80|nr:FAD-binding domain-containing protein [Ilumatobacter sp.]MDJ0769631.1 FAD-binding domain-containing protein [Ilumatobacter sp.]
MNRLPVPRPGRAAAEAFVDRHLVHVAGDAARGSERFRGGQSAADAALAAFDVAGYASRRNEVRPTARRGASGLSPYIRHGLLTLPDVWRHVAGGPARDVAKFRDELLWQEYARHWYARLGAATGRGVRRELAGSSADSPAPAAWDRSMACLDANLAELERDGWLVNQSRMWLASHWAVREAADWRSGEDAFFRHLLDGSRAANRLGWQWTAGVGSSKHYGFSRSQVRRRAPGLCDGCERRDDCPIEAWPDDPAFVPVERNPAVRFDPDVRRTRGPDDVERRGGGVAEAVWLTAESLGAEDPASVARPDLPVVFVFDEPLLARLQLSSKRLVFLVETLAERALTRGVELWLGDPVAVLGGRRVAVTFAPVPGFRRRAGAISPAEVHPWPWLATPTGGPISSFSAWRRAVGR